MNRQSPSLRDKPMSKKYHIDKQGKKWYFKFVEKEPNSLLQDYSLGELGGKMIVSLQFEYRMFAVFDSHIEFANRLFNFSPEYRCFFEVVVGGFSQKPHFDIDISRKDTPNLDSLDKNTILNNVIESIIKSIGVELNLSRDVLVFSSHSPDKISFHVVIDNYCHCNNEEAKHLYTKVIKNLPEEYSKYVDHSVYSKLQQFRIVGSRKFKTSREKVFVKEWNYFGKEIKYEFIEPSENERHEFNMLLSASLLANTYCCNLLPTYFEGTPKIHKHIDIGDGQAKEAMSLLLPYDVKNTYEMISVVGSIICLRRLRPSKCPTCMRIHEAENPYLVIVDGSVYFDCRRANGKRFYLGKITSVENPQIEMVVAKPETLNCIELKLQEIASRPFGKTVEKPHQLKVQELNEKDSMNIMKETFHFDYNENTRERPSRASRGY
jgi:hypothetical protein